MQTPSIDRTVELLRTYGYALLLVACLAENLFLVGLVVPGDAIIVVGGALCARANLSLPGVLAAVAAGAFAGANISYWIGRIGGMALVERWGDRAVAGHARRERIGDYFWRHGATTVFFSAFVMGIKNLVPTLAGASGMPVWRFAIYSAGGSVVRSVALVLVGYLLGASLPRAVRVVGLLDVVVLGAVIAVLIGVAAIRLTRARRR